MYRKTKSAGIDTARKEEHVYISDCSIRAKKIQTRFPNGAGLHALIEPRRAFIHRDAKTAAWRVGQPDLANGPALEEVVDGDEDVGYGERGDGAPDEPDVAALLRRDQAQQEEADGEADEVHGEQIRWLRGPEPLEGFGDVGGRDVVNMAAEAQVVGVDDEGIAHNHDDLEWVFNGYLVIVSCILFALSSSLYHGRGMVMCVDGGWRGDIYCCCEHDPIVPAGVPAEEDARVHAQTDDA